MSLRCSEAVPATLLALVLVACASTAPPVDPAAAPAWVGHFGVFEGADGRTVEAVGSSATAADPGSRRATSLSHGRAQLALTVDALTAMLAGEFVAGLRDGFADELVESGRFVESVSRQVTDEVMRVSPSEPESQPLRWTDPITKMMYVLMSLPLDTVAKSYHEQMNRAFQRESTLGSLSAGADAFSELLDQQLEQLREQPVAEISARFSAR